MHKAPRKRQLSKLEQDASVLRPLDVRASYHSCMAEGMAVEDSFRRPAQLRLRDLGRRGHLIGPSGAINTRTGREN